ncbi:GNAT family N-acetyltransferase [Oligoflexia bacterium]|nr:GNAT family N-acetyltransferase [Oligoflexia bacterium]
METFFLESARLKWRKWTEEDADLASTLWSDPKVTQFFDARHSLSRREVLAKLDREISCQSKFGVQYWPMFFRETSKFVGAAGLRPYDLEKSVYEKGTHLIPSVWGKGLGTEAGLKVIEYAFEEVGAKALFVGHNPANTASVRMIEKQGFTYTHDQFYEPTGLNHPSYLLKAEEYFEQQSKDDSK